MDIIVEDFPLIRGFSHPWSTTVQKQGVLPQARDQKVHGSLPVCHSAYAIPLTLTHHTGLYHLTHHKKEGEYITIGYLERERESTFM